MSEKIQTIDVERWSEPDESRHVKFLGMMKAKDAFDELYAYLEAKNMLPDEYFIFSDVQFTENAELPDYSTAVCHVDFGSSEGIYLDIILNRVNESSIHFATGKTLDENADAFFRMSRIAADCSLMLNGRGSEYVRNNTDITLTPDEVTAVGGLIEHAACDNPEPEKAQTLSDIYTRLYQNDTVEVAAVHEQDTELEP